MTHNLYIMRYDGQLPWRRKRKRLYLIRTESIGLFKTTSLKDAKRMASQNIVGKWVRMRKRMGRKKVVCFFYKVAE